jgi:hypothetical protein
MRRAILAATLAAAAAGLVPAAAQASFTVAAQAATASESAGTAGFTVSRGGPDALVEDTTLSVTASGGAGPPSATSLHFAANDTTPRTVTVPIDDDVDQNADPHAVTVTIAVSSSTPPPGEMITTASATTQVSDNDTTIDVAPGTVSVGEGGTATITLTPRAQVDHAMTVTYSTAAGSAAAGSDFAAQSGTVTWQPTTADARTISVPTTQDAIDEDDETLAVSLSVAGGAIAATSVPITIADDDPPPLVAAVGVRVEEGSAGVHGVPILVGLSAPSAKTVSVAYATRDGTATAPSDYGGAAGRVTFAPGETVKTVTVLVGGDKTPEPDEAFVLELMNPENATLAGGQQAASVVLADDDGFSPVTGIVTPGASSATGKDVTGPRLTLGRLTRRTTRLSLPVRCPKGERFCSGTVSLFTIATAKHPERRLARARFTLKGGAKRTVTLTLSKSARAYVKRLKRVKVRAYVVAQDPAGNVGTAAASATLGR